MSKMIDKIKTIFRINHNVIKGEISELTTLSLSDEDKAQGKAAAVIAVSVLAGCGVPLGALGQPILEKVFAYVIRDVKDGVETPNKLIIGRIIEEIKREKESKTKEDILYDNLNKTNS